MSNSQDPQIVRTEMQDDWMGAIMAEQTAMLRTVLERLDELVQLLTPKPTAELALDGADRRVCHPGQ